MKNFFKRTNEPPTQSQNAQASSQPSDPMRQPQISSGDGAQLGGVNSASLNHKIANQVIHSPANIKPSSAS